MLAVLHFATIGCMAATQSFKQPIAPKWGRFEHVLKSSVEYANPLQDVSVRVVFTSPAGETSETLAFWDGGSTWRVRFSPDQVGGWVFTTICSDTKNAGLHYQAGGFLCTANLGQSRFNRHGPVELERSRNRFSHADGTPFYLLADTSLKGG